MVKGDRVCNIKMEILKHGIKNMLVDNMSYENTTFMKNKK